MAKNIGSLPAADYNPFFLADEIARSGGVLKAAAIRKDYSNLRKTAQKRLNRFEGTEWMNSNTYRYNKGKFKKLDEIKSAEELAHLLVDVKLFLESPTGSISGLKKQRAEIIESMHEHGYTWINAQNFKGFTEFMDSVRAAGIARLYDSDRLGELYNESRSKGVSSEELAKDLAKFTRKEVKAGRAGTIPQMDSGELARRIHGDNNRKSTSNASGRSRKRKTQ